MAEPSFLRKSRYKKRYIKPSMSTLNAASGIDNSQLDSDSLTGCRKILEQLERGELVIISKNNKPACEYVQSLVDCKYASSYTNSDSDDYYVQRRDKKCRKQGKSKKRGRAKRGS